jgi:lipopolysaccharide export LptBFGC system permease protein LptF
MGYTPALVRMEARSRCARILSGRSHRASQLYPDSLVTIVGRYIIRQIAVPTFLALLVVGFLGVANEIRQRVRELADLPLSEIGVGDAARIALLFLPALSSFLVPITFMMGILMAFSRLAHQNEIVALKAAGIPLKRVIVPVLVLGALLSGLVFISQDRVQPWAVRQLTQILYSDLPLRATLDVLPAGVMHDYADWRVYIGSRDNTGKLHDIRILAPTESGPVAFYAGSAKVVKEPGGSRLVMEDVEMIPTGQVLVPVESLSMRIPALQPKKARHERKGYPLSDLLAYETLIQLARDLQRAGLLDSAHIAALGASQGDLATTGFPPGILARYPPVIAVKPEWLERIDQYRGEAATIDLARTRADIAQRTALPFACLAVCLAAAPLAIRSRQGGRSYAFVVGLTVLGVYFLLHQALRPQGLHSLPIMLLLAWIPNVVLAGAGVYFLWRVDRV